MFNCDLVLRKIESMKGYLYEKIDDQAVYSAIPLALSGFREYMKQVLNIIEP